MVSWGLSFLSTEYWSIQIDVIAIVCHKVELLYWKHVRGLFHGAGTFDYFVEQDF